MAFFRVSTVHLEGRAMNLRWATLFYAVLFGIIASLLSCTKHEATQEDVREFFATHKIGNSPDYAIVKNGTDYLAVIYGMADDLSVCMDLIKPYNKDPSLSTFSGTYSCVPLNH
jgi:hypothetical protein